MGNHVVDLITQMYHRLNFLEDIFYIFLLLVRYVKHYKIVGYA